jgi:hypothetical protein
MKTPLLSTLLLGMTIVAIEQFARALPGLYHEG